MPQKACNRVVEANLVRLLDTELRDLHKGHNLVVEGEDKRILLYTHNMPEGAREDYDQRCRVTTNPVSASSTPVTQRLNEGKRVHYRQDGNHTVVMMYNAPRRSNRRDGARIDLTDSRSESEQAG